MTPYGMDEHELRMEDIPHEHLELQSSITEVGLAAALIDYEKKIGENCIWDPAFTQKVNDLFNNYSLDQLQLARSQASEELFFARAEMERFVSLNMADRPAEQLSAETLNGFSACSKRLETAILNREMLKTAIEIKSQDQFENLEEEQ